MFSGKSGVIGGLRVIADHIYFKRYLKIAYEPNVCKVIPIWDIIVTVRIVHMNDDSQM